MNCPPRTIRLLLALAIPLLVVSSACTSTPGLQPEPTWEADENVPNWRWMPHSWEKLNSIETWLVGAGPRLHPEWVAEAELLLAEGRLRFAQEEAAVIPASTQRTRVAAAQSGLRRVLSDPFADESIKARARRALGELQGVSASSGGPRVADVLPRSSWGGRAANPRRLTPTSGRWRRITVHHSANEAVSLRGAGQSQSAHTIAGIQAYHMNEKGWGDIGYHFLIDPQGRVFAGRSLRWQGAHAGGVGGINNIDNIGICLLGNFQDERPSAQSIAALQGLLNSLRSRFGIPLAAVSGHQLYKSTACPGRYLTPWVEAYRRGQGSRSGGELWRGNGGSGSGGSPDPWPAGRVEHTAVAARTSRTTAVASRPQPAIVRKRNARGRVH